MPWQSPSFQDWGTARHWRHALEVPPLHLDWRIQHGRAWGKAPGQYKLGPSTSALAGGRTLFVPCQYTHEKFPIPRVLKSQLYFSRGSPDAHADLLILTLATRNLVLRVEIPSQASKYPVLRDPQGRLQRGRRK